MRILKSLFALAGAAVLLLAGCTTKEQEIAVTGVSLTPSTLSIKVGETQTLTAEVQPSNATDKKVSWSTDDPEMNVIVLNDTKVKGIAPGNATVTVTTSDGNFTATCAVTVTKEDEPGPGPGPEEIPVTSIDLEVTGGKSLYVGETATVKAVLEPSNTTTEADKIVWKSSDEKIATVEGSGKEATITAVAVGKATISASVDGKKAEVEITVNKTDDKIPVTSITLAVTGGNTLAVGGSAVVKATLEPSNTTEADKVAWKSSDEKVATVKGNGKEATITAVAAGKATISASVDGKTAQVEITVEEASIAVNSITMDPESATIGVDQEMRFHAVIDPADATNVNNVEWTASPASKVQLTPSGGYCKVKALAAGTVTLTATVENKEAKATITITEKPAEVEGTVDLGLPSGTLWCEKNLGADYPSERGQYFAWGETKGKSSYSGSNYKFGNLEQWYEGGSDSQLDKYNEYSGLSLLEAEDDAATQLLGENYHTPTLGEWAELWNPDNCKWEWTTYEGVDGYRITSKRNGKFLFLPATGWYDDDYLYGPYIDLYYWTSTLDPEDNYSHSYEFGSWTDGGSERFTDLCAVKPYYGENIRAVYSPRPVPSTGISAPETVEVERGKTYKLNASVLPASAPQTALWYSSSENIELNYWTGEVKLLSGLGAEIIATDGTGGHQATVILTTKPSYPEPEAVDLGLTVKWSSWDLGASKVGEPGYLFAWGETDPKLTFSYKNYKWWDEDNNTVTYNGQYLANKDDAAAVHLGGKWCMPTKSQFEELIEKCTIRQLDKDDPNNPYGITVLEVKGKQTEDGNRNIIYLPFGGWGNDGGAYNFGEGCFYQTNEKSSEEPMCNYYFYYDLGYDGVSTGVDYDYCFYANCIRPVWNPYGTRAAEVRSLGPVSYYGHAAINTVSRRHGGTSLQRNKDLPQMKRHR